MRTNYCQWCETGATACAYGRPSHKRNGLESHYPGVLVREILQQSYNNVAQQGAICLPYDATRKLALTHGLITGCRPQVLFSGELVKTPSFTFRT